MREREGGGRERCFSIFSYLKRMKGCQSITSLDFKRLLNLNTVIHIFYCIFSFLDFINVIGCSFLKGYKFESINFVVGDMPHPLPCPMYPDGF